MTGREYRGMENINEEHETIKKRSVFLIGGYEPKSSDAFFKRTRREMARFCDTWDVKAQMQKQALSDDGLLATAHVDADMHGNQVETNINFFVWNDIVLSDFRKPTIVRVAKYLVTLTDYLATGTFFRIVSQAWRFSLYFVYPAMMLAIFTLLSFLVASAIASLDVRGSQLVGAVVGLACWFGILRITGRRWFVMHLMDLWSFSRNYLRGLRPDAREHIERFGEAVADQARTGRDDEIVLVGHSTGGALILDIAATALEKYSNLGRVGPRVTVLTVGSTALKIGLHPAAVDFRRRVQSLVDAPAIQWIECQAMTDVINFYKTDPVSAMKLSSHREDAFPQVHVVRIRDMLQPEFYQRFKYNFFRVHYQFIMANTKQYAYDFFMMCCGEKPFAEGLGSKLRYSSRKHR